MADAARADVARRDFDAIAATLQPDCRREAGQHVIATTRATVRIPLGLPGNGFTDPDRWLARTCGPGRIHEPGLMSALCLLGARLGGARVVFVDIGALFGFVGLFAEQVFPGAGIRFVDAHPGSAAAIEALLARRAGGPGSASVHGLLVGTAPARRRVLIDRFRVLPAAPHRVLALLARDAAGNALRRLAGRPAIRRARLDWLQERPLSDLVADWVPEGARPVLKIDTEGHQADFLPPATRDLIGRRAAILMELDAAGTMRRFGRTNADLCRPFLDAGYAMLWVRHRDPDARAEAVTPATLAGDDAARIEQNSLAILLPPDLY